MAVSQKEMDAYQKMWEEAKAPGGADIPEGDYEFLIIAAAPHLGQKGKAQMKQTLRIVGGQEDQIGQEFPVGDNLDSPENLGWFTRKLGRLGIEKPESFSEVIGTGADSVCHRMIGRKFAGTVKVKNDFMNVYVNRLIGTEEVEAAPAQEESEDSEGSEGAENTAGESALEKGDIVNFTLKGEEYTDGEIVELLDTGLIRVKHEGVVYKVKAENVTAQFEEEGAEGAEGEGAEGAEEEGAEGTETTAKTNGNGKHGKFPKPKDVAGLKLPQLKDLLKQHGLSLSDLKTPREFAVAVAGFVHDAKYLPQVSSLPTLCAGLGVKYNKGAKPGEVVKAIRTAVLAKFK